jgi:hypothetical protein
MNVTVAKSELDITLDLFGQRLVPIFTQINFCFAIPDGFRVEDISGVLSRGTERLAVHFPWVAGQVVCDGATKSSTGSLIIEYLGAGPRVWVRILGATPCSHRGTSCSSTIIQQMF